MKVEGRDHTSIKCIDAYHTGMMPSQQI